MIKILKINELLAYPCKIFGGICLMLMMCIPIIDICTRALYRISGGNYNFTIKGSVELVSYLMFFAISSGMAAYIEKSQIIVDVFAKKISLHWKSYIQGVCFIIYGLIGIGFSIGLYKDAHSAADFGEITLDLYIPLQPLYFIASIIFLFLTIRAFLEGISLLSGRMLGQGDEL